LFSFNVRLLFSLVQVVVRKKTRAYRRPLGIDGRLSSRGVRGSSGGANWCLKSGLFGVMGLGVYETSTILSVSVSLYSISGHEQAPIFRQLAHRHCAIAHANPTFLAWHCNLTDQLRLTFTLSYRIYLLVTANDKASISSHHTLYRDIFLTGDLRRVRSRFQIPGQSSAGISSLSVSLSDHPDAVLRCRVRSRTIFLARIANRTIPPPPCGPF
jgi:hypothetical protein